MKRPFSLFFAVPAFFALASSAPACGGDDTSPTGGTGGSGGSTTGTAGSGGSGKAGSGTGGGGTGGGAGTGGSAGTAGGTADSGSDSGGMTMTCGNKTCGEISVPGLPTALPPCCPTGEMNACGGSLMSALCLTTTMGRPDPSCPDVMIPMAPAPAPGCCGPTGFCGAELGAPLGCNDLSPLLGGTPMPCGGDAAPPPRDSAPDNVQPPADTGAGDTGSGDTGGMDTGTGDATAPDGGSPDSGSADASSDRSG